MRYLLVAVLALLLSTGANASVYFATLKFGGPGTGYFIPTRGSGDVDFTLIALKQDVALFEVPSGATIVGDQIIFDTIVQDQYANQLSFSSLTYTHNQLVTDPTPPDNLIVGQATIHIPSNAALLDLFVFDEQESVGFNAEYGLTVSFDGDLLTLPSNFSVAAVPEPSTWSMLLIGFAAIGFAGYRKGLSTHSFRTPSDRC